MNRAAVIDLVKKHSMEFARTAEKHDAEVFGRALHDQWFMIDATGKRFSKDEELALLRGSDFKPSSLKVEGLHVELFGDTAVVTGISNVKARYKEQDISGRYRFTQVWKAPSARDLLDHGGPGLPHDFAMITCITFDLNKAGNPADPIHV